MKKRTSDVDDKLDSNLRLLRISELAEAMSLSVDTLETYIVKYGMPYVVLPSGQRRFFLDEVRQWFRELQRTYP